KLAFLWLYDNKISSVHVDSFKNMSSLRELDIGCNKLKLVEADTFKFRMFSYNQMSFSENKIESLNFITQLNNTNRIYLANNLIKNVTRSIFNSNLKYLKAIDLSNNPISYFQEGAFDLLTNLDELLLTNVGLKKLNIL